jgi:hypothetical protein
MRRPVAILGTVAMIGLLVGLLLFLVFSTGKKTVWVGFTDLEVEFVVTDADNGKPIDGATIFISAESGGYCEEQDKKQFQLTTQSDGIAKRLCKQCMCFGTVGWNVDTFMVHLPKWHFFAATRGYRQSEWEYFDTINTTKYSSQVRRGNGSAQMMVCIEMRKR